MGRPQATPRAIAVARGDEAADLLITGGVVDVGKFAYVPVEGSERGAGIA